MTERDMFEAALELPLQKRVAYLDSVCGTDAALRQRLEALLRKHDQAGSFLEAPAVEQVGDKLLGHGCPEETEISGQDLDFLGPTEKPGSLGRLSHYEILEVIGRGGMGIVLRAFDDQLHRVVAIKVMTAYLAASATARKRFTREAQAQAAVSHDHVVTIHAVEEANGLPYLVMQFVPGMSLQERLDRSGPLALAEIVRIGMQTASGLAAAHAQGLSHRDVKPANILLENGVERVKLTDFGLARAADDASLTQSGVVAGTPQYMSPEQARGERVDRRSDLFSLGSVLYALCTGRPPFRANSSMAVLKRVCEEAPRPVRDTNPDIPDWLVTIIEKLHAKDPAARYQSAAEVAELLRQHLEHLAQASQSSPLGRSERGAGGEARSAVRRRGWAVAASILLLLLFGFSLTEATGVTKLTATAIRILTPEGTLVVEVDDPGVKVTIEGDGGIVITGAGPQEVRLRPGAYKVHANRDGQRVPLERELVSIAKGGREVVRVKVETARASAVAKSDKGVFVLQTATGAPVRRFDTLAHAVTAASDGDIIEVRGNGPFVTPPVKINDCALTIRAAEGFRPVIRLSHEGVPERPLSGTSYPSRTQLETNAVLVLEGLEFQLLGEGILKPDKPVQLVAVVSRRAPLYLANCRVRVGPGGQSVRYEECPSFVARNCEFLEAGNDSWGTFVYALSFPSDARAIVDNCVQAGHHALNLDLMPRPDQPDWGNISVQVRRSTCITSLATFQLDRRAPTPDEVKRLTKNFHLEASESLFATRSVLMFLHWLDDEARRDPKVKPLEPREAEKLLRAVVDWREHHNLYSIRIREGSNVSADFGRFTLWGSTDRPVMWEPAHGPQTLSEWTKFWGAKDTDCLEALARFEGGDLLKKVATDPDTLTPDDFRLRPDSAGYRAGPGGKDLGADIDLVGPGKAYQRWKKTPAYQQWLKETGQKK